MGEPYCLPPGKGREHPDIGESVARLLKTFYKPFNLKFYKMSRRVFNWQSCVLLDFSLSVKAATLIFISGRGSAILSAKEGKSGFIYNLVKSYY